MKRQQSIWVVIFAAYMALLLYFLFFGFGRPAFSGGAEYRYALVPLRIPLWLPKRFAMDTLWLWIFSLGNLLAFLPLGLLAPKALPGLLGKPARFFGGFLLFITTMEVLQMVTYLGSFDVEDILVNTMGAAIGFYSGKIAEKASGRGQKLVVFALAAGGFCLVAFLVAWAYNSTITPLLLAGVGA